MGIKNIVLKIIEKIPSGNVIMFESIPDFSDSPMAVFEEMLKRGMDKKYKFVWWVSDKNKDFKKYPNTVCVDKKSKLHFIEYWMYLLKAKCLISCNAFLTTATKHQKSFYITHGTVIKNTGDGYVIPETMDYTIIASEDIKDIMSADMKVPVNKLHGLGYPRNDAMQNTKLIALAGLIIGISATFSMAASEFLSARQEGRSDAFKSCLYTGTAYLVTVALLIMPYLILGTNMFIPALIWMLAMVIAEIAIFTFYISVAKSEKFKPKFLEMSIISIGVAVLSFGVSIAAKAFLGVDI
jgi:hypothetical protein